MLTNTCPHCGKDLDASSDCPHCGYNQETPGNGPAGKTLSLPAFIIALLIFLALIAAFLVPNSLRARVSGRFTACQSHLKNISTALDMYAADHKGHYPMDLSELSPAYMKDIPTCYAADYDTYSESYISSINPDAYSFYCSGDYHTEVTDSDYPQYNSREGLITRP